MVTINYEIPEDLHRQVKATAAKQGTTLRLAVLAALDYFVQEVAAGRLALVETYGPGMGLRTWERVTDHKHK